MTKVLGSRDVSRAEALHCLQDIPLHDSNVTIVRASLQSSKEVVSNEMGDIEYSDSLVDIYAKRRVFERKHPQAVGMNFLEFASTFEAVKTKDEIRLRGNPRKYAVRIWEKYSANPNGNQFDLHCKYQLLRY
jgi:hypothetical protein